MPIPNSINDLSTTAASNFPQGSDSPANLDDVQRAHGSFIAQLRDGTGFTSPALAAIGPAASLAAARTALGAAASGANTDITSISGNAATATHATTADAATIAANGMPVASIVYIASSAVPTGFLKANGASVSTTTYAALFAVIGYLYGGSGASFLLPDLRGEFLRGWDDARGIDSGRAIGTAQAGDIQSHTHTMTRFNNAGVTGANGSIPTGDITPVTTNSAGLINATGGIETRPRNVALLACIKY